jgi:iron-sulfur cluster repair protein YtfE (RIC family)
LTQKHNIEGTFGIVIEEIKKITIDYDVNQGITGYYARHLGIVTHYLADYCTFPHNSVFQGSIKDHCKYEKEMKFSLREYVERDDVQRERKKEPDSRSIDDIFQLIVKTHREYLKALNSITQDIHYIVDLCYKVVDAILQFFELAYASLHNNYREQKSMI